MSDSVDREIRRREEQAQRLAERIRERTSGMWFRENGRDVAVDALSWAYAAIKFGHDFEWALDWVRNGYPSPPPWMFEA